MIGMKTFQYSFHCLHDVGIGKIKVSFADPALGLDEHPVTQAWIFFEDLTEELLTMSAAVDVGMVKEVDAQIQNAADEGVGLFRCKTGNAHAASRHRRNILILIFDVFHIVLLKVIAASLSYTFVTKSTYLLSLSKGA